MMILAFLAAVVFLVAFVLFFDFLYKVLVALRDKEDFSEAFKSMEIACGVCAAAFLALIAMVVLLFMAY